MRGEFTRFGQASAAVVAACVVGLGTVSGPTAMAAAPAPAAAAVSSFEVPGSIAPTLSADPNGDLRFISTPMWDTAAVEGRMPAAGGALRLVRVDAGRHGARTGAPLPGGASAYVWLGTGRDRHTVSLAFRRAGVNGRPRVLTTSEVGDVWPGLAATTAGEVIVAYTERVGRRSVARFLRLAPGQTDGGRPITPAPTDPRDASLYVNDDDPGTWPAFLLFTHRAPGSWAGIRRVDGDQIVGPMLRLGDGMHWWDTLGDIAPDGTIVAAWTRHRRDHAGSHVEYPHLVVLRAGALVPVDVPLPALTGPAALDEPWPERDLAIAGDRVVEAGTTGGRARGLRLVSVPLTHPDQPVTRDLPGIAERITELRVVGRADGSVDVLAITEPEFWDFNGGAILRIHGAPDGTWDAPVELWATGDGRLGFTDAVARPTGGLAIALMIQDWDLVTYGSRIVLTDR